MLKPIPGYDDYFASDEGKIFSNKYKRMVELKQGNCHNYRLVILYNHGICKTYYVHRLITLTFIGECSKDKEVNHINGIKSDNRIENLEYVTSKENKQHCKDTGLFDYTTYQLGEKAHGVKLTNEKVLEIRELYKMNNNLCELGRNYNVTDGCIRKIIKRETWKHI